MAVGYAPDRPVLQRLNLRIDQDDRIALLGQNGNGKSTFAKLIAGKLGRAVRHASTGKSASMSAISPSTSSTS